jgi:hypothetical protein
MGRCLNGNEEKNVDGRFGTAWHDMHGFGHLSDWIHSVVGALNANPLKAENLEMTEISKAPTPHC